MSKVFSSLAVSVDGYITGRDPGTGRGLGDGSVLFDWFFSGDQPSQVFDGFRLSGGEHPHLRRCRQPSRRQPRRPQHVRRLRVGQGRHAASHRPSGRTHPPPGSSERSTDDRHDRDRGRDRRRTRAGRRQRRRADGRRRHDGGADGRASLDEVILHQVPVLLGGGRPFFQSPPGAHRASASSRPCPPRASRTCTTRSSDEAPRGH